MEIRNPKEEETKNFYSVSPLGNFNRNWKTGDKLSLWAEMLSKNLG